ncbi:MAG: hypothetical protein KF774_14240 [Planctomyces sp.]|nr:hypothetical protein [Planctomyces sp.]
MRQRLRLFNGEQFETSTPTVSISFGEFRRIVLDAQHVQRSWLRDFDSDELQVPEDLYDVLTAYRQLMPGA